MTTLNLLYFARLRDALGCGQETLTLDGAATVASLLDALRARGGVWAEQLDVARSFRVAVNQTVAHAGQALADGDEVAIFPPVTGG